jgi:hypothetical protein
MIPTTARNLSKLGMAVSARRPFAPPQGQYFTRIMRSRVPRRDSPSTIIARGWQGVCCFVKRFV